MAENDSEASAKAALREEMRAARRAYVLSLKPGERGALERALGEHVRQLIPAGAVVGAYVPVGEEIDPKWCADAPALPWFADRRSPMRFRLGPPTARGPFACAQPDSSSPFVEPDLLLMPLLAADHNGNRLGQGGGKYDRWIGAYPARAHLKTIGLAWDCQIVEHVPREAFDAPLDAIATPTRVIEIAR